MDWATAIASNPLTPWGIVGTVVIAVLSGLLVPWRTVKREHAQSDSRIARTEALAAATVAEAERARVAEVARVEQLRMDEVARVERLHQRIFEQKDELLSEQRNTIRSLTESVHMYARAAEADITTADIVKNVFQALQSDAHHQQRQLEEGPPHG